MKKTYQFNNVTYGYSVKFRKWIFAVERVSFLYAVTGGVETAHKIAHLVNSGFIRTKGKGIDNLARANISHVNS